MPRKAGISRFEFLLDPDEHSPSWRASTEEGDQRFAPMRMTTVAVDAGTEGPEAQMRWLMEGERARQHAS